MNQKNGEKLIRNKEEYVNEILDIHNKTEIYDNNILIQKELIPIKKQELNTNSKSIKLPISIEDKENFRYNNFSEKKIISQIILNESSKKKGYINDKKNKQNEEKSNLIDSIQDDEHEELDKKIIMENINKFKTIKQNDNQNKPQNNFTLESNYENNTNFIQANYDINTEIQNSEYYLNDQNYIKNNIFQYNDMNGQENDFNSLGENQIRKIYNNNYINEGENNNNYDYPESDPNRHNDFNRTEEYEKEEYFEDNNLNDESNGNHPDYCDENIDNHSRKLQEDEQEENINVDENQNLCNNMENKIDNNINDNMKSNFSNPLNKNINNKIDDCFENVEKDNINFIEKNHHNNFFINENNNIKISRTYEKEDSKIIESQILNTKTSLKKAVYLKDDDEVNDCEMENEENLFNNNQLEEENIKMINEHHIKYYRVSFGHNNNNLDLQKIKTIINSGGNIQNEKVGANIKDDKNISNNDDFSKKQSNENYNITPEYNIQYYTNKNNKEYKTNKNISKLNNNFFNLNKDNNIHNSTYKIKKNNSNLYDNSNINNNFESNCKESEGDDNSLLRSLEEKWESIERSRKQKLLSYNIKKNNDLIYEYDTISHAYRVIGNNSNLVSINTNSFKTNQNDINISNITKSMNNNMKKKNYNNNDILNLRIINRKNFLNLENFDDYRNELSPRDRERNNQDIKTFMLDKTEISDNLINLNDNINHNNNKYFDNSENNIKRTLQSINNFKNSSGLDSYNNSTSNNFFKKKFQNNVDEIDEIDLFIREKTEILKKIKEKNSINNNNLLKYEYNIDENIEEEININNSNKEKLKNEKIIFEHLKHNTKFLIDKIFNEDSFNICNIDEKIFNEKQNSKNYNEKNDNTICSANSSIDKKERKRSFDKKNIDVVIYEANLSKNKLKTNKFLHDSYHKGKNTISKLTFLKPLEESMKEKQRSEDEKSSTIDNISNHIHRLNNVFGSNISYSKKIYSNNITKNNDNNKNIDNYETHNKYKNMNTENNLEDLADYDQYNNINYRIKNIDDNNNNFNNIDNNIYNTNSNYGINNYINNFHTFGKGATFGNTKKTAIEDNNINKNNTNTGLYNFNDIINQNSYLNNSNNINNVIFNNNENPTFNNLCKEDEKTNFQNIKNNEFDTIQHTNPNINIIKNYNNKNRGLNNDYSEISSNYKFNNPLGVNTFYNPVQERKIEEEDLNKDSNLKDKLKVLHEDLCQMNALSNQKYIQNNIIDTESYNYRQQFASKKIKNINNNSFYHISNTNENLPSLELGNMVNQNYNAIKKNSDNDCFNNNIFCLNENLNNASENFFVNVNQNIKNDKSDYIKDPNIEYFMNKYNNLKKENNLDIKNLVSNNNNNNFVFTRNKDFISKENNHNSFLVLNSLLSPTSSNNKIRSFNSYYNDYLNKININNISKNFSFKNSMINFDNLNNANLEKQRKISLNIKNYRTNNTKIIDKINENICLIGTLFEDKKKYINTSNPNKVAHNSSLIKNSSIINLERNFQTKISLNKNDLFCPNSLIPRSNSSSKFNKLWTSKNNYIYNGKLNNKTYKSKIDYSDFHSINLASPFIKMKNTGNFINNDNSRY